MDRESDINLGFKDERKGNVMALRKAKPRSKMIYGKSQIPAVVENATPEQRRNLVRRLTSRNRGNLEGRIQLGDTEIEFLESSETRVSQ